VKFTIGSQPQAIFQRGDQTDVTVTNDGPFTVYLDENSAITSDQAMPLPPLSSVKWKAHTPLWAMANDNHSTVRVARTDSAPVTPGDGKQRVLYSNDDQMPTAVTGLIETGSYQSLFVRWRIVGNTQSTLNMSWYSTDGKFLRHSRYRPPLVQVATYYHRATIPVYGAFVSFSGPSAQDLDDLLVIGSTSQLETSMYSDFDGSAVDYPIQLATGVSLIAYSSDFAQFTWDLSNLESVDLHQLGTRLICAIRFPSAPSETGNIELQQASLAVPIGPTIPIVVGTLFYYQEWTVPLSQGYSLVCTNVVASPVPTVSLIWSH